MDFMPALNFQWVGQIAENGWRVTVHGFIRHNESEICPFVRTL